MYIVLSGFITHLAYGSKSFNTVGESCKFYLCRFGRIWLTFYFSLALGFVQLWLRNDVGPFKDYVLALLLLDSWFPVYRHELAEQHLPLPTAGWTLSTLTLPWVLYPALNAAFRRVPARIAPTVGLMLLFSVTAIAPALVMFLVRKGQGLGDTPGELISGDEYIYLYMFPPLRLSEFLLGMASSQLLVLLRVDGKLAWPHWQWVGWASAAAIVVTSASVPTDPNWVPTWRSSGAIKPASGAVHGDRVDQEALFISIFCPAWALVIIAANAQAQDSSLVRTLRHPVISSIGGYSFAVYLFQFLWYYAWLGAEASNVPDIANGIYAAYLTGFLLTLWLSAGVWSELVEAPFAKALKELLADEVKQQKVSQADDPSAPPAAVLGRFRLLLPTALRVGLAFVVGVSILLLMYWLPSSTEDASVTDEPATNPAALANFTRMANAIATVVTNGTSGLPLRLGANVLQPAH